MFHESDSTFLSKITSNAQKTLGIFFYCIFFEHKVPNLNILLSRICDSLNDRRVTERKYLNFLKFLSNKIKKFEKLKFSVDLGQPVR